MRPEVTNASFNRRSVIFVLHTIVGEIRDMQGTSSRLSGGGSGVEHHHQHQHQHAYIYILCAARVASNRSMRTELLVSAVVEPVIGADLANPHGILWQGFETGNFMKVGDTYVYYCSATELGLCKGVRWDFTTRAGLWSAPNSTGPQEPVSSRCAIPPRLEPLWSIGHPPF